MHYQHTIKISKTYQKYVLLVVGLGLVMFEGYSAVRSVRARSWEQTSGTITEARVSYRSSRSVGSNRRHRSSRVRFEYRYGVNGKTYRGRRINFGGLGKLFTIAGFNPSLQEYSRGQSTTVFYDPKNPHDAVLEPDFPLSATIALGAGVSLLVGAILMTLMGNTGSKAAIDQPAEDERLQPV